MAPQVVEYSAKRLATNVDAQLEHLRVTFGGPMAAISEMRSIWDLDGEGCEKGEASAVR